jgi:hypothetical protein
MVAYHAEWRRTEKGHAKFLAKQAESRARYPERQRARDRLRMAILRGDVLRGPCEFAGPDCRGSIEGHHDDYSLPLVARWVCRKHHRRLDRARPRSASSLPVVRAPDLSIGQETP